MVVGNTVARKPAVYVLDGCIKGKRHRWCNHPGHLHCVVCGKYRETT